MKNCLTTELLSDAYKLVGVAALGCTVLLSLFGEVFVMKEYLKPTVVKQAEYRIARLRMCGNEGNGLRPDCIYCALVEIESGHEVISATLDYVLAAIRDRGYVVEGVTVGLEPAGPFLRKQGVMHHSFVQLDAYA